MPRPTKGHKYVNFPWNSLKIKSGNLHIIPNQHIIFQDLSLSTFLDILLTRPKCAEPQRAVTISIFYGILSKSNQIIYTSFPLTISNFKNQAWILFEISCSQDLILIIFQRGITLKKTNMPNKKKNRGQLFFHMEPIYKISKPWHAGFLRYGMHKKA